MNRSALPEQRTRSKTILNITLAVIGVVLLLVTVRRVGWREVQSGLTQVGGWFLLVLALGLLRFTARARAWLAAADSLQHRTPHDTRDAARSSPPNSAPRTPHFLGAVLAADALGNLTPLGLLASEPAKILFVRDRLPAVVAIASVAIENAFYIASVIVMLAAGAAVFINLTNLPTQLRVGVQVVLAGAAVSAIVAVIIARHKPAVLSRLARWMSALTGRANATAGRLEEIEAQFYGMLTWPARRVAQLLAWEALFHVAAVAEVYLVLRLLPAGSTTSLADAFVLETTGRLIAVAFKFVPYRLGVDEAGTAIVATALAIDPTAGVTLALIRRIRILVLNAVGLIVLARRK